MNASHKSGGVPAPGGPRLIILMGLRGSGKSTLGRMTAARAAADHAAGARFIDLDDRTMARLGFATVSQAWAAVGQPAFRAAETEALRAALDELRAGGVLALGGGTPTAPGAEALLRRAVADGAALIYLRCTPAELRARLSRTGGVGAEGGGGGAGPNRPSLTGRGALDEIEEVFAARDPLYRSLATTEIENPGTPDEAVEAILKAG